MNVFSMLRKAHLHIPHNASIFTATMPDDRQISVPYAEIISFETATVTQNHPPWQKPDAGVPDQLNALENKLNDQFFRCHRSIIINLMNVKEVDYKIAPIIMSDGTHYPLSIRKKVNSEKKPQQSSYLVTKNLVHQILMPNAVRPQHISSLRECASLARSAFS